MYLKSTFFGLKFKFWKIACYIYDVLLYHLKSVMKKPLFLIAFTLITAAAFSQDVIRLQSCSNEIIGRQVDSLKSLYSKDGYILLKEASINMESEFEMPVILTSYNREVLSPIKIN